MVPNSVQSLTRQFLGCTIGKPSQPKGLCMETSHTPSQMELPEESSQCLPIPDFNNRWSSALVPGSLWEQRHPSDQNTSWFGIWDSSSNTKIGNAKIGRIHPEKSSVAMFVGLEIPDPEVPERVLAIFLDLYTQQTLFVGSLVFGKIYTRIV